MVTTGLAFADSGGGGANLLPPFYFIDLHWAQLWMELIGGRYIFHMTAQVERLSLVNPYEIGFFIESDNNLATGEPPDGTDYYLA